MRTIIADTSALYVLVDADDAHHAEAVAFLKQTGKRLTLAVLETTLFETLTLIKSRLGQAVATRTLNAMQTSSRYRIISLTFYPGRLKSGPSCRIRDPRGRESVRQRPVYESGLGESLPRSGPGAESTKSAALVRPP